MPTPAVRSLSLAILMTAAGGCEAPERAPSTTTVSGEPSDATEPADLNGPGAALTPFPDGAADGAVVYIPVYSHIYHDRGSQSYDLAVTLSVRNTDPEQSITVGGVSYYDSDGGLAREYLDAPIPLGPLASRSFVVPAQDVLGGSGANFLVNWWTDGAVAEPLVEAVMISTASSQGLSFTGDGRVIRRLSDVQPEPEPPTAL